MTLEDFQHKIAEGMPLEGTDMVEFMRQQSDISQRLQAELNCKYNSPDDIRGIFSKITGTDIDKSFRLFPPFYTDFGKNIHVGKNVFINSNCQFQDQGGIYIDDGALIGHSVILATLNHHMEPAERQNLYHAPIHIGKGAWIGARATILAGVSVGDNAVVAAGAVVTRDVPANMIVAGVPAKVIKSIYA